MGEYVLLPGVIADRMVPIHDSYLEWLKTWLFNLGERIERGAISSSECVAGYIAELLVGGRATTDWMEVMKGYLESEGTPLAYSAQYGRRLNNFRQWKQSPVHSVYSRWWIERQIGSPGGPWEELVRSYIQPSGWIYNREVSPTQERTRMKSELVLSLVMGLEILSKGTGLEANLRTRLLAAIVNLPLTGYASAEYFRLRALEILGETRHMVVGIDQVLKKCKTVPGFSDYSVQDKVDDYMGTAKRTARDVAIFSPISTLHAMRLARSCGVPSDIMDDWGGEVRTYLASNPLRIPALRMRDLPADFGDPVTPYEIIAAAHLVRE